MFRSVSISRRSLLALAMIAGWVFAQFAVEVGHWHAGGGCCDGELASGVACHSHDGHAAHSHSHGHSHDHAQASIPATPTQQTPHDQEHCSLCRLIATPAALAAAPILVASEALVEKTAPVSDCRCDSPSLLPARSRAPPIELV